MLKNKLSYVDLSSNSIALMSNYKPNAKLTQYSGTKVAEIQVVAESTGTLHIGTAKVSDIVTARTAGSIYTATTTSHNVVAGVNTITFATPLELGEDETIVIGGSGSTAKVYVVTSIPVDGEQGNFALINGESNTSVISKTGSYADTLAIRVKAEVEMLGEVSFFPEMTTQFPNSVISSLGEVNNLYAPFVYQNSSFSGKTITSIGVPVSRVIGTGEAFITVYKVKTSTVASVGKTSNVVENAIGEPIKLIFEDAVANQWAYADCNIELGVNETLAFGAPSGDTLVWKYAKSNSAYSKYYFYTNDNTANERLLFDVKVQAEDASPWTEHLDGMEEKEQEAKLTALLFGKQLSILGDSISTYTGVSNSTAEDLGNNAIYYNSQIAQTDTYWQQIIDKYGMNLCVNNAWSGSYLSQHTPNQNADKDGDGSVSSGMARANKLAKRTEQHRIT